MQGAAGALCGGSAIKLTLIVIAIPYALGGFAGRRAGPVLQAGGIIGEAVADGDGEARLDPCGQNDR